MSVFLKESIESSSVVVQWVAVDDSLITTYVIVWTRAGGSLQTFTLLEQTSYTITGLILDTVYTITVTARNRCGQGPEFRTSVSLSVITNSTTSNISPTVTAHAITDLMSMITIGNDVSNTTSNSIVTTDNRNISTITCNTNIIETINTTVNNPTTTILTDIIFSSTHPAKSTMVGENSELSSTNNVIIMNTYIYMK